MSQPPTVSGPTTSNDVRRGDTRSRDATIARFCVDATRHGTVSPRIADGLGREVVTVSGYAQPYFIYIHVYVWPIHVLLLLRVKNKTRIFGRNELRVTRRPLFRGSLSYTCKYTWVCISFLFLPNTIHSNINKINRSRSRTYRRHRVMLQKYEIHQAPNSPVISAHGWRPYPRRAGNRHWNGTSKTTSPKSPYTRTWDGYLYRDRWSDSSVRFDSRKSTVCDIWHTARFCARTSSLGLCTCRSTGPNGRTAT